MAVDRAGPSSPELDAEAGEALAAATEWFAAGRYDEALRAVAALHERCREGPVWQARAALLGAKVAWNAKRPEVGLRWADTALDLAARLGMRAVLSEAWALKGACHALQPQPALSVQCLDRALRELTVELPPEVRRIVLTAVGLSFQYLGLAIPAAATLRRACEISRQHDPILQQLRCGVNLAYALVELLEIGSEQPSAALASLRAEAWTVVEEIDRKLPADASDQLFYATRDATARLALSAANPEQALGRLTSCLDRGTERRPIHLLSWYIDLAYCAHELGRPSDAHRWSALAQQILDAGDQVPSSHIEFRRMARLARVNGDAGEVMHWMRRYHARIASRQQAMLDAQAAELHVLETNQTLHLELNELRRRDEGLRRQFEALDALASTDALTGLLNRRGLAAAHGALATGGLHLLLIDIDHFKAVNDRFGHAAGDAVLQCLARCMGETFRGHDRLARLGGEEFVALLSRAGDEGACAAAERLRQRFELHDWCGVHPELRVTLSAGLIRAGDTEALEQSLARADAALYSAKAAGRNRVVVDLMPAGAHRSHA